MDKGHSIDAYTERIVLPEYKSGVFLTFRLNDYSVNTHFASKSLATENVSCI